MRGFTISTLTSQFRDLLEQFGDRVEKAESSEKEEALEDRRMFESLLNDYARVLESYCRQQEAVADDFNLMEVLQLTTKETRHTMVLAWLLDHDFQHLGTHAQGNLGFKLFLEEFELPAEYASHKYRVIRESPGDGSIVDIEIACRDHFIIHIENKIWSKEGIDQTDREWSDLQRKTVEWNVNPAHVHAFFLTPDGTKPRNRNFTPIRWVRIANILERFEEQAKPQDVRLFASHYARGLRRFIVKSREDDHAKATLE